MPIFKRPPNQNSTVPAGIYVAQVMAAETRVAQTSGNTYIQLRLRLIPSGAYISTKLVFTVKSAWVVADFCASAGLILTEGDDDFNLTADDCIARVVYIRVEDRENQFGNTFSDVRKYLFRDKALKKNPELAKIQLPKNVPPVKQLTGTAPTKPAQSEPPDDLEYNRPAAGDPDDNYPDLKFDENGDPIL